MLKYVDVLVLDPFVVNQEGWRTEQVAGSLSLEARKTGPLAVLKSLIHSKQQKGNWRVTIDRDPRYCIASGMTKDELDQIFAILVERLPHKGSAQSIKQAFHALVENIEVPMGDRAVPIREMSCLELETFTTSAVTLEAATAMPIIWHELAQREVEQMEVRLAGRGTVDLSYLSESESSESSEEYIQKASKSEPVVKKESSLPHLDTPEEQEAELKQEKEKCKDFVLEAVKEKQPEKEEEPKKEEKKEPEKQEEEEKEEMQEIQEEPVQEGEKQEQQEKDSAKDTSSESKEKEVEPELDAEEKQEKEPENQEESDSSKKQIEPETTEQSSEPSGPPLANPKLAAVAASESAPAPPTPPPAPREEKPIMPKLPFSVRRLHGCGISTIAAASMSDNIWSAKLDHTLTPLTIGAKQWQLALSKKKDGRTMSQRGVLKTVPHGKKKKHLSFTSSSNSPTLVQPERERDLTVTLKNLVMHGILDMSKAVSFICTGSYPDNETKLLVAEMSEQLGTLTPTAEEIEAFQSVDQNSVKDLVRAEQFLNAIINQHSVELYVEGLNSLRIWMDGEEQLAQLKHDIKAFGHAIEFLESDKDFFKVMEPIIALVVQVEGSSTLGIDFCKTVQTLTTRKTTGSVDGKRVTLLVWMHSLHLFPAESIHRIVEFEPTFGAAQVLLQDDARTKELLEHCKHALSGDKSVESLKQRLEESQKTQTELKAKLATIANSYGGKELEVAELLKSVQMLLQALKELDEK